MKVIETDSAKYYIGQNSSENDELFYEMPKNAIWFHLDSKSSSHVYCMLNDSEKKISKEQIKKGAELVKQWSKKDDKVIYIQKSKLKRLGPGLLDLIEEPKYA